MNDTLSIYESLTDEEQECLSKFAYCFRLSQDVIDIVLEDYAQKRGSI